MDTINLSINKKIYPLKIHNNNNDSLRLHLNEELNENQEHNQNFDIVDSTIYPSIIDAEIFSTNNNFNIDSSLFSEIQWSKENSEMNRSFNGESMLFSGVSTKENSEINRNDNVGFSLFSGVSTKENSEMNQNFSLDSSLCLKENTLLKQSENNDKKSYCINCGKNGHVSKKCLCPIISIGIICVKLNIDDLDLNTLIIYSKKLQSNYLFSSDEINKLKSLKKKIDIFSKNINNNIEYLLIRRKNSLNYVEFIRGKYDLYNLDYLIKSFNFITTHEKNMIQNNNFEYLWKDLWSDNINYNNNEFKESCEKFNLLKKGIYIKKNEINIFISINILIKNSIYNFTEPEWGYPKGRRNMKEKNIDCAKREFEEETLIKNDNINIINITPFLETYIASNGLKYKHIYYVSQIKNKNIELKVDNENMYQKIEIGDIRWFKFHEGIEILRNYNIEKKNVLLNLHYNIKYMVDNLINCIESNYH